MDKPVVRGSWAQSIIKIEKWEFVSFLRENCFYRKTIYFTSIDTHRLVVSKISTEYLGKTEQYIASLSAIFTLTFVNFIYLPFPP